MVRPLDGECAPAPDLSQSIVKRLVYMYGAVTLSELNRFLDTESIDTDDRKHEIRARWRDAARAVVPPGVE